MRRLLLMIGTAMVMVVFMPVSSADCRVVADCCIADAGACSANKTCSCSFTCGPGISSCSCKCIDNESTFLGWHLSLALDLSTEIGLSFTNGPTATTNFETLGEYLEETVNWQVQVDTTVQSVLIPDGSWTGSIEDVISDIASAAFVDVSFDDTNKEITFSEL